MIAQVGWTDDWKYVVVHVQTKRVHFSVDMTPDEAEEFANSILTAVKIARDTKGVSR